MSLAMDSRKFQPEGVDEPFKLVVSATPVEVAAAVGQLVSEAAQNAIADKGAFAIALSGGSLVKILGALANDPLMDWSKWHVFWADERLVPLTDSDSNYKGADDEFISKTSIPKSHVYPINADLSVADAAAAYEDVIRKVASAGAMRESANGVPSFDLILLGMGPDGHCASLFPEHELLAEDTKLVAAISDSPKPPPERITLTMPVLNAAKKVAFVASGGGKAPMLKRVMTQGGPADRLLPVQRVQPSGGAVWHVDEAAASDL